MKTPGIYRRGKVWRIAYRDQYGRQHFETVRTYREAVKARTARLAAVQTGKFRLRREAPTLKEFVEGPWRNEVAISLKPSTRRGYETALRHHLLPAFGAWRLDAISRGSVKAFIAKKAREQRFDFTRGENPNPDRPTFSRKTILNMVGLLASILDSAALDYNMIETNPLRGILRRRNFPADMRAEDDRVRYLEPGDFRKAVEHLKPPVLQAVVFAALTGLRWGEQVALRMEDIDLRRNRLHVSRSLYRRMPQPPKTRRSVGDVDLCPTVRRLLQAVPWKEGYVFSVDGVTPLGDGSWLRRQWRKAQVAAGIRRPIGWHDLRHEFVCLLIGAGKHVKYIAQQARHYSAGFTLDRYGGLFETIPPAPVEWWDDLIWPPAGGNILATEGVAREGKRGVVVDIGQARNPNASAVFGRS